MCDRDICLFDTYEGMTVEESLRESFAASLDDVMAAYGRAIGVPGLKE